MGRIKINFPVFIPPHYPAMLLPAWRRRNLETRPSAIPSTFIPPDAEHSTVMAARHVNCGYHPSHAALFASEPKFSTPLCALILYSIEVACLNTLDKRTAPSHATYRGGNPVPWVVNTGEEDQGKPRGILLYHQKVSYVVSHLLCRLVFGRPTSFFWKERRTKARYQTASCGESCSAAECTLLASQHYDPCLNTEHLRQ